MTNSTHRPPPTLEEINSRVYSICRYLDSPDQNDLFWYLIHRDREPSAKMTKVERVALEFLKWRDDGGAVFKTHHFKDRYDSKTLQESSDREKKASTVRPMGDKLRDKLDDYYEEMFGIPRDPVTQLDPTQRDVDAGRAEWIVYIKIPERHGWKPAITWRARAIEELTVPGGDRVDFECIGTNVQAMKYLSEHIPLARRVEDTAIRWDATKLPYTELNEFQSKLKESKASYRLITGQVKYKAYMEVLREVYSESSEKEALLRCFRMDRALPIMNFTILYYPKELQKASEVLYGYGIKEGKNSVDGTIVFRTNNPDLVKEYMRLFEALRNHPLTYPVSIHDPDFIDSNESENDVSATMENFGLISIERLVKRAPSGRIDVCVPCSNEIDRIVEILGEHLSATAPIRILLSHPDSPFLSWRAQSLVKNLKKLVRENLESLQRLLPRKNYEVKLTDKTMPVMFFQVGNSIIFSPFWNRKVEATSSQFIVHVNSKTGSFFEERFEELWKDEDAMPLDLSEGNIVIPSLLHKANFSLHFNFGITVRKARADDALAVGEIASSRSRTARLQAGVTERQLSREGFLFYPLNPDQYLERIEGSDHFWVAEKDGKVVAYCMAYTFTELQSFTLLTDNDQTVLEHFSSWGCEPGCVYFAQTATIFTHEARGAMAALAVCLPKHATERGAPAILCEISLRPRNEASLLAANRSEFRMVATRTKTDPTDRTHRVSGTFMRILESKAWR